MKRLLACFLSVVLVQGSLEALARQLAKSQLARKQISAVFTPTETPEKEGNSKLASGEDAAQVSIDWVDGTPFDRDSGLSESSNESSFLDSSVYSEIGTSADESSVPATEKFSPAIQASKASTPRVQHAGVTPFLRRFGSEGHAVGRSSAAPKRFQVSTPASEVSNRRSRLTPLSVPPKPIIDNSDFSQAFTPRKSRHEVMAPSPLSKFVGGVLAYVTPTKIRRASCVEQWFACESTRDALEGFIMEQRRSGIFSHEQIKSELVNAYNSEGKTRLHAYFEELIEEEVPLNLDVVECLLDLGADINKRDLEGNTPLQVRVENRYLRKRDLPEIQKLIALGADPKLLNGSHETILHVLASPSCNDEQQVFNQEMIDWWIDKGVNPRVQDTYGFTILHILALRGSLATYLDLYTYLIKVLKVDPNLPDSEGNRFLHLLAEVDLEEASYDMLKKLQELGVDMAAQNEDGDYYINILSRRGKITTEMVSWWKTLNPAICTDPSCEEENDRDSGSPANGPDDLFSTPRDSITPQGSPLAYIRVSGKNRKVVQDLTAVTPAQKGKDAGKAPSGSRLPTSTTGKGSEAAPSALSPVTGKGDPAAAISDEVGKGGQRSDSQGKGRQAQRVSTPDKKDGFVRRNAPIALALGAMASVAYYVYVKSQKSGTGGTFTVQAS